MIRKNETTKDASKLLQEKTQIEFLPMAGGKLRIWEEASSLRGRIDTGYQEKQHKKEK